MMYTHISTLRLSYIPNESGYENEVPNLIQGTRYLLFQFTDIQMSTGRELYIHKSQLKYILLLVWTLMSMLV